MYAKVVKQNDNYMFDINGKLFVPAAFRSFRPSPANVSLFYRNGIRLFQMQVCGINNTLQLPYSNYGGVWVGDHEYDFTPFDRQISMFRKFAPDGYFMIMLPLDMPDWWLKENNCEYDSYYHLGEAYYNQKWRQDASDYLQAFVRYAEEKYGDCIFAYSISCGSATEWFDCEYQGASEQKAEAYRKAIGEPDIPLPTVSEMRELTLPTLYDNDSHIYKYLKYCSQLTPELIEHFTAKIQEVIHHQKIVGMFFGYTDMPQNYQNQKGTNGYERIWANDNIDMLFSPASYRENRLLDGASSYQYAVDSVAVHDKLYLHEIDHRTYLSTYPLENTFLLECDYENEEETITVLRRELCATAEKGGSLWWFDFMGGYYASPGLEQELQKEMAVLKRLYEHPHKSVSEIAVFVDPMSFLHMKDCTSLPQDCVRYNRNALHECGAPYDYFNLNDISKVNLEQYKLFVFLNALDMAEDVKTLIQDKLQNKTKAWVYAPNFFSGKPEDVCGMKLKEIESTDAKVIYGDKVFGFTDPVAPMFAVSEADAETIATYENGEVACAKKGNQIYLATGNVPPELWCKIAKDAGVHLYTEKRGALYADSRFIARQTMHETEVELHLPFDCVLEELFDGGIYETDQGILRYQANNHETKLFLIKEKK